MGAGVKCVVTGANIKALGRAIHSLSRIGEELYLEPLDDGLCLRSVNSSRSAYACFTLAPLFFYAYEATGGGCHCKIYMKSVMSVFRSLPSLEKKVEKCVIKLNTDSSRLVIQLFCKYGVTKTHNLSYQDCESLQAVYNPDSCPNVLRAHARLLSDAVVHFPLTLAEVTLGASPCGKVTLRNYVEEEIDPSKAMLTELSLSREEFLAYQLQEQREITFCLREFRGLLAFAESSSLPISIQFDSAGCPVIFSVDDAVLEAHFVLATLSDAGQASQSQNHSSGLYSSILLSKILGRQDKKFLQRTVMDSIVPHPNWHTVSNVVLHKIKSTKHCPLPREVRHSQVHLWTRHRMSDL
ncbi:cell cycle checkpoint control protein RAD9A isoform X2 [Ranitomeya imitator]|uniref:cell cycle checkpoint control protein RAD9A isoform X2 n=1 Tax=Ranitomeya imitator TaxID=111125 RepID=UPI0037E78605